jgi:hypothetical protein
MLRLSTVFPINYKEERCWETVGEHSSLRTLEPCSPPVSATSYILVKWSVFFQLHFLHLSYEQAKFWNLYQYSRPMHLSFRFEILLASCHAWYRVCIYRLQHYLLKGEKVLGNVAKSLIAHRAQAMQAEPRQQALIPRESHSSHTSALVWPVQPTVNRIAPKRH